MLKSLVKKWNCCFFVLLQPVINNYSNTITPYDEFIKEYNINTTSCANIPWNMRRKNIYNYSYISAIQMPYCYRCPTNTKLSLMLYKYHIII